MEVLLVPGGRFLKETGLKEKEEEQFWEYTRVNYLEFSTSKVAYI